MTARVLQTMVEYFGQERRYVNHALKVFTYAKLIGVLEGLREEKLRALECAAILHDIGIPESLRTFGSAKGEHQEITGMKVANELLTSLGFSESFVTDVTFLIAHHHSYNVDGGLALQILFEADFLVNVDEGNLGDCDPRAILEAHFQTKTGRELFSSLYGIAPAPPSNPLER